MNKELVIEILKSAKGLSQERVAELVALVPESDRAEVLAIAKAADGATGTEGELDVEQLISKAATEVSKATGDQLKVLQDGLLSMQKILEELVNGLKSQSGADAGTTGVEKAAGDADPAAQDQNQEVPVACACGEKLKKGVLTCPKCGAEVPTADNPEVTPEQFQEMLDKELEAVVTN